MKTKKQDYPILPLGEDWRIRRFDPMNIVLEQRKMTDPTHRLSKGEAREVWEIEGYYEDLPKALDGAIRKRLQPAPLTVLAGQIEALRADIAKVVDSIRPQRNATAGF